NPRLRGLDGGRLTGLQAPGSSLFRRPPVRYRRSHDDEGGLQDPRQAPFIHNSSSISSGLHAITTQPEATDAVRSVNVGFVLCRRASPPYIVLGGGSHLISKR